MFYFNVSNFSCAGSTAGDEMCNLYLMYYTDSDKISSVPKMCVNDRSQSITRGMPEDSDKPLPPNPRLEQMAKHKINKGDLDQVLTRSERFF